jgi:hypothetical protein
MFDRDFLGHVDDDGLVFEEGSHEDHTELELAVYL